MMSCDKKWMLLGVQICFLFLTSGCSLFSPIRDMHRRLVDSTLFDDIGPYVLYETYPIDSEQEVQTNRYLAIRAERDRNYAFIQRNWDGLPSHENAYRLRRFHLRDVFFIRNVFSDERLEFASRADCLNNSFDETVDLSELVDLSADFCAVWVHAEERGINIRLRERRCERFPYALWEIHKTPGRVVASFGSYDEVLAYLKDYRMQN